MVRVVACVQVVVVQRAVQPVVEVLHGSNVHEEHDEQPRAVEDGEGVAQHRINHHRDEIGEEAAQKEIVVPGEG